MKRKFEIDTYQYVVHKVSPVTFPLKSSTERQQMAGDAPT